MKKRLEADLMSIAHRVLQIKDKSDVAVLCNETRKLYEKLAILQFVETHFGGLKPTIGQAEILEKMKQVFEDDLLAVGTTSSPKDLSTPEERLAAPNIEIPSELEPEVASEDDLLQNNSDPSFKESNEGGLIPDSDWSQTPTEAELSEEIQISFMDVLGGDYSEATFVKRDPSEMVLPEFSFEITKEEAVQDQEKRLLAEMELDPQHSTFKKVSLNEKVSKGINIDLNDRIAFVKNLFANSEGDYNRVLNQLITYDSYDEAYTFIEDMVKPDYNNWDGKEEYSQRFMKIIEKKFA